jgi:hypothetical protein
MMFEVIKWENPVGQIGIWKTIGHGAIISGRAARLSKTRLIRHKLHNPTTNEQVTKFSETLFQATMALHTVFSEYGQAWQRGTFTLTFDVTGRLTASKMNYHYDDCAQ